MLSLSFAVCLTMTVPCKNSSELQHFFVLLSSMQFSNTSRIMLLCPDVQVKLTRKDKFGCLWPLTVDTSAKSIVCKMYHAKSTLSKIYIRLLWAHSRIQNDVWLIKRLLMSAKASVKLNRGLRYHESENFVCCDVSLLFSLLLLYFWFFSWLIFAAMFWKPDSLRLRPRFICGLWRGLVMLCERNIAWIKLHSRYMC